MTKQPKFIRSSLFISTGASASALKGRQSVRATFKLTEQCIDAISIVANQLGIKQKSLFDHLLEDAELLEIIARELRENPPLSQDRRQKTYVISRNSLMVINHIAEHYEAPRDSLIELIMQRLLPIIVKEKVRYQRRKEIIPQIEMFFKEGQKKLAELESFLGPKDILTRRFAQAINAHRTVFADIKTLMDKAKSIENFDTSEYTPEKSYKG